MSAWLPNLITAVACLAIAARLLAFRKRGRRHNLRWAALAWLLINASIAASVLLLTHFTPTPKTWVMAVLAVAFAVQTFRCGGNVAKLWRLNT